MRYMRKLVIFASASSSVALTLSLELSLQLTSAGVSSTPRKVSMFSLDFRMMVSLLTPALSFFTLPPYH